MNLEDLLSDLKKEYLSALPDRIENMRRLMEDPPGLREAFHKIKGTGKTYGIPELSQVAEVGESICRDRPENIPAALPLLLGIMTDIHKIRTQQQSVDVDHDPRFSELTKL